MVREQTTRPPTLVGISVLAGILLASSGMFFPSMVLAEDAKAGNIEVQVRTFRNQKGHLGCALFAGPKGFPVKSRKAKAIRLSPIKGKSATCRFNNVRPGTYAVAVLHDEDKNGKLKKNFLGVPQEGYGVSNNHVPTMRTPKYEKARFNVKPEETKRLRIKLKY